MKKVLAALFLACFLFVSPSHAQDLSKETRAVWVTRWQYKTEADVIRVMDTLERNNVNTVFFQVRGEADAFYASSYEPWSSELTGTLGKNPGFDPLAVAVREAHARGIKIHAWMNMMTLWKGKSLPDDSSSSVKHILNTHPEWQIKNAAGETMPLDGNYVFADPTNLQYQRHLLFVVAEVAKKYDVDGIHMDYIRFPSPLWGLSPENVVRFERQKKIGGYADMAQWRRGTLTRFIGKMHTLMQKIGKNQELSASVIGYYQDIWGWGYENSGSFDKYLQDSKEWVRRDYVSFIAPMIYWTIGAKPEFETLVKDFTTTLPAEKIVVGMSTTSFSAEETMKQVAVTRKYGARGFSLFSFESNASFWTTYAKEIAGWGK
ncbi:hypothetical protein COW46_01640 [Candidatus Gracilibacteria bacterium CG17_big_fil_post_rev_8_21_14_2_50_48_13]|nr:MAG: hypothetical protein COW46_01640 [Candidatus Gracilibacteria bacterium CG17_big_fil_post_rev_8_21_14_2_50_48_13]